MCEETPAILQLPHRVVHGVHLVLDGKFGGPIRLLGGKLLHRFC